ncbi:hypothetical protein [Cellvibrio polysaccharolyticus]|uniref:hypothetical protein n=1 Tax=Cellvibrio polysaccharolyticus TaxID=2082724 RepID=UPI001880DF08|nr:hypothetical protein [Cellvibrio polysaccharolyticus]
MRKEQRNIGSLLVCREMRVFTGTTDTEGGWCKLVDNMALLKQAMGFSLFFGEKITHPRRKKSVLINN